MASPSPRAMPPRQPRHRRKERRGKVKEDNNVVTPARVRYVWEKRRGSNACGEPHAGVGITCLAGEAAPLRGAAGY